METGKRSWRPGYVRLARSGELEKRAEQLDGMLTNCTICPRRCGVDRRHEAGDCNTLEEPAVASWGPHRGEEPVLSCRRGSGTVFLANCNLDCVFCQNHDISHPTHGPSGSTMSDLQLAAVMIELQDRGCHNINWVSPSHQVPQLVRALAIAAGQGLGLPIVYNSNGYDGTETLRLLEGIVDIYMPDFKYSDPDAGCRLSGVADYPDRAREALAEMYRQVDDSWDLGPEGELRRGLLIRMLVLPDSSAGIEENVQWISNNLSPQVAISLLAQYHPSRLVPHSRRFGDLDRGITRDEWRKAVAALEENMVGDRHYVQGVFL